MKQNAMKTSIQPKRLRSAIVMIMALALIVLVPITVLSQSSTGDAVKQQSSNSNAEQELINLSKEKWRWMSERKVGCFSEVRLRHRLNSNISSTSASGVAANIFSNAIE